MSSAFFDAPKGIHTSCEILNSLPADKISELAVEVCRPTYTNAVSQKLIELVRTSLESTPGASVPSASALQGVLNALAFYYHAARRDRLQDAQAFQDALKKHSSMTQETIALVVQAWSSVRAQTSDLTDLKKGLSLGRVVGFDWKLGVGVTSSVCENIKQAFVSVVWKIADPSGQIQHHHMELSIPDFKELHQAFLALQNQLHS